MAEPDTSGPNAEQERYWNETGQKWVAFQRMIDQQIRPLGRRAMERAGLGPGARVLDVGCGCGDTTVELAERVGPTGEVVGLDLSAPMLARASALARERDARNVRFVQADAQTHVLPVSAFDVVFSRFGVMFFSDPAAAFRNLRTALRPAGRVVFACWQPLARNPWMAIPLSAAARHLTLPPPPAPDAPGPFSFGDPERVRRLLTDGGLTGVVIEPLEQTLTIGGEGATVDEALQFLLEGVGPTSRALRESPSAARQAVSAAVREAIAPFHTPAGLCMASAAWIVTARRESS